MPVYDDWKAANAAQRYAKVKRVASGARDPEDVKREHDAMVEAMMAEMSPPFPRPKPTLKMTPQDPFFRGSKVVQGFQALAAAGNPEYLSAEWHSAPKLYVTAWGRAYVGPAADTFWVNAVNLRQAFESKARAGPDWPPQAWPKPAKREVSKDNSEDIRPEDEDAGDTPLPVGMRGSVLVFGFVMCSWGIEFGREALVDKEGNDSGYGPAGPTFALHPVGPQFRWYSVNKLRKKFAHPQRCLEHLAKELDDKLRLNGSPQKEAKSINAWALFGMLDDSVASFLREHLQPFQAGMDNLPDILKERRKRHRVNAYLADMLQNRDGFGLGVAKSKIPDDGQREHNSGANAGSEESQARTGPYEVAVSPERIRSRFATTYVGSPSAITPPPPSLQLGRGDGRVSSAPPKVMVWRQARDSGLWEQSPQAAIIRQPTTRDLDITSPFLTPDNRLREERSRVREGRDGPGSQKKLAINSRQARERAWQQERRERLAAAEQEAERKQRARATSLKTLHRACALSLFVSSPSKGGSPLKGDGGNS